MRDLGWREHELLQTKVKLFAANKKQLTVLGALPVMVTVGSVDGTGEIMIREMLYCT